MNRTYAHSKTLLSESQRRESRGAPAFAESQRGKILELLRQAGPRGISREALIFTYRWTQAGTRIFELEQEGFVIRHETRPGDRFVTYILESEPLTPAPLPDTGRDWYEEKFGKRPSAKPDQGEASLPLFGAGR